MTAFESYLVIGGSGFLGRHIVEALVARGEKDVAVLDIVQRYDDVRFFSADITNEADVADVIRKANITCIIHTASPVHGLGKEIYWKVNVDGTKAVIAAAQAHGVKKLVYTSSAGVVYNGEDLIDAEAEKLVLAANGVNDLLTVAIRPAGIFGPGDRQVMKGLMDVVANGQTRFQIGSNNNLFDWTYVTNVAHAHLLAADKLGQTLPPKDELLNSPLPPVSLTTDPIPHRIPTSAARPLGPTLHPTETDKEAAAAFETTGLPPDVPVLRTKFDPLSEAALSKEDTSPLSVAGQAFFITNGEPVYFWDFTRAVWRAAGHVPNSRFVFPKDIGLMEAGFTRFRVTFACASRWYNIEKARRVLGYEPQVGLEEGVQLMVDWWKKQQAAKTT
ncbi:3-beta hydroxysteroid dehydrogenase/isomerase family protein [Rhizoctonia solani]|uniref:3-beta hydroxysteroid dehydrogenase/isomerase family protein n=1 Tax=Rhizoctonia solani TaxID=456999 RepID=A0A8H8T1K5_9AGAM|nr:3-beta hydroxysteroid dehydrogenase/isomerase family protein [Rhizoctonia solani]QRW24583.1 3-beta hydroxysteroid dehydrogenase/isomerase family protein [Rhizoctonia solani]